MLATFAYPQGGNFALQRQQVTCFAIGWQPGSYALQSGQETILQEVLFGGYRLVIKFKDWIWQWDNRGYLLQDLFEDFYAIPPGGGAPVNAGTITVKWEYDPTFLCPLLVIISPALADWYYFQRFPPATRPYWATPHDRLRQTPFWFPP